MNLYLDISGGISGDMFMAALLGLGADFEDFCRKMKALPMAEEFDIRLRKMKKGSIEALKVDVLTGDQEHSGIGGGAHPHHHREEDGHSHAHPHECDGEKGHFAPVHTREEEHRHEHGHPAGEAHAHHHRNLRDILEIIERAEIPPRAKELSVGTFHALADAEAKVHGMPREQVHFHEVGAVDSIVDIIGVCLLIDELGIEELYYNELPMGQGQVQTEHGLMPIPAPATLILMEGMRAKISPERGEMVTPTGAALLKALGAKEMPFERRMEIFRTSISCGQKEFRIPNILRGVLFHFEERAVPMKHESLFMLECNIDDMTGEFLAAILERLLRGGALDAWIQPVIMKKGRPAYVLKALTTPMNYRQVSEIFLDATTTLGLRMYEVNRTSLDREKISLNTSFGDISIKSVTRPDGSRHQKVEFDDIKRLAEHHGVSELRMEKELRLLLDTKREK